MKKNPIFVIASIALFIAIADMPYGYYQLLRFFICGVGAYGVYLSYEQKKTGWAWVLGVIALLFNPFMEFYFEKDLWEIIDVIAGVIFLIYFVIRDCRIISDEIHELQNRRNMIEESYKQGSITKEQIVKDVGEINLKIIRLQRLENPNREMNIESKETMKLILLTIALSVLLSGILVRFSLYLNNLEYDQQRKRIYIGTLDRNTRKTLAGKKSELGSKLGQQSKRRFIGRLAD